VRGASSAKKSWTEIIRAEYQRNGLRYASDMTDAEWALIARRLPRRRRLGRPREVDLRKVLQAQPCLVFADRIYRGNQLVTALSHCGPWTTL
jgi:transposase